MKRSGNAQIAIRGKESTHPVTLFRTLRGKWMVAHYTEKDAWPIECYEGDSEDEAVRVFLEVSGERLEGD